MATCDKETTYLLKLNEREAAALLTVLAYVDDNPWTDGIHSVLSDYVGVADFKVSGKLSIKEA